MISCFFRPALLVALLLATPIAALAQPAGLDFADALVRASYFEGLPYLEARRLTPAGVEHLVEMLQEPAEAEHHEHIAMALGMSGASQAFQALVEFHESEVEGEVDAAQYRSRRAIPIAMGYLAGIDPRALRFLLQAARRAAPESAPRWRYLYLRDQRLAGILRRAAITGVAMSGQPEAVVALRALAERARDDLSETEELRIHVREAQRLCDRVAQEGREHVFGSGRTR